MVVFHSFIYLLSLIASQTLIPVTQVSAQNVTVYYQEGQGPQATLTQSSVAAANYTGAAAYNPQTLIPPPVPTGNAAPGTYSLDLTNPPGPLSIPIPPSFFGFSIEMSVSNQVLGKNSTFIQVPFLNLMGNLIKRSGIVHVRVGGNTQESAALVDTLDNGKILEKQLPEGVQNGPTNTPILTYTRDMLYMMRNISDFLNVHWFLGAPFFNTTPFDMDMMVISQQILGDYLLAVQAGNEPDQYGLHGHRDPNTYNEFSFHDEFGQFITQMNANDSIPKKNLLLGPSISTFWQPEQVWNTGFISDFRNNLAFLSVELYPDNNCAALFPKPGTTPVIPQDVIGNYLSHQQVKTPLERYINSTKFIQQQPNPLPFIMFETNTASCGGFVGISDTFVAALWGLDWTLQMASMSFSGVLMHIGGQGVFYNPFTPPPTNQSSFHQWTIGPMYYAALVMSEVIGPTGKAQVIDLNANNGNDVTPAYAVYEDGKPVRLALFNYVTDNSGAASYTVNVAAVNGATSVKTKTLAASSVSQKGNYTWAGQTFGGQFSSDGRPIGNETIDTVQCNNGQCPIKVNAPSFVLVFFSDDSINEVETASEMTFATTLRTKTFNTATVDPSVLATSNGHKNSDLLDGSTSKGKSGGVSSSAGSVLRLGVVCLAVVIGRWSVLRWTR